MGDYLNSLPNNKFLDGSKLKASADDKIIVIKILKIVLQGIGNIVGKGENAGNQHFHFPTMFSKKIFVRVIKSLDWVVKS